MIHYLKSAMLLDKKYIVNFGRLKKQINNLFDVFLSFDLNSPTNKPEILKLLTWHNNSEKHGFDTGFIVVFGLI